MNLGYDELLARAQTHFEEIAPRICEQYGLDAVRDRNLIRRIDEAQREIAECENCMGEPCQKSVNRYFCPVIRRTDNGNWHIPAALCQYGKRRMIERESRTALIPVKFIGKTFSDYEVTPDNERAVKIGRWFAEKKPNKSLYLFGGCGTGKTFLAAIIAQNFIKDFKQVVFGDVPSLLDEIKRTFNTDGNSADVLDRYCNCDLLVLDDLGAGQITEWNVGILYEIINRRYSLNKSTLMTSNFDLDGLEQCFGKRDSYSAKRITSRISEMCTQAFLGTTDRRKAR